MTYPYEQKPTDKLLRSFSNQADNPYLFAVSKPYPSEEAKSEPRLPHEEKILREQRLTFFEHDESTRRIFQNDFEAYSRALDNPELMMQKLEEKLHALEREISAVEAELPAWWQDEFWGDEFIEDDDLLTLDFNPETEGAAESDGWVPEWQDDPLYQKANKWAHRLFSVGQKLYEESREKDPDLFRVLVNIFLVPAKIVYASSVGDEEFDEFDEGDNEDTKMEAEISLHGYALCSIFLRRVRESLVNLAQKNLAPAGEWRAALLAADELALEVQGRMIELAKRLRE